MRSSTLLRRICWRHSLLAVAKGRSAHYPCVSLADLVRLMMRGGRNFRDAGYPQIAQNVDGIISAPDKQRGGVFGVARQMANCLTSAAVLSG